MKHISGGVMVWASHLSQSLQLKDFLHITRIKDVKDYDPFNKIVVLLCNQQTTFCAKWHIYLLSQLFWV